MSSLSDSAFCTYRFSVPGADDGLTIAAVVISIAAPSDRTVQIKDLQIYECGGSLFLDLFQLSLYIILHLLDPDYVIIRFDWERKIT